MDNQKEKLSNVLIGIAGVHFVVSQLSLKGLIALPTMRNTAGIDIIVSSPDGKNQAALQVKTSSKKVTFWPMSRPEKCLKGPRSYYIFLRYIPEDKRFEAFLEDGDKVTKQVIQNLKDQKEKGRSEFSCWYLPSSEESIRVLREKWNSWKPPEN